MGILLLLLGLCVIPVTGCGQTSQSQNIYVDEVAIGDVIWNGGGTLENPPAIPDVLHPEASGILVQENEKASIDYSHTEDGYVLVRYIENTDKRLKVQVKGPTTTYTYNITPGNYETFPLSDGNGEYQIAIYENVVDKKYALSQSIVLNVELKDEFAPFIRPNQYVDYGDATKTLQVAALLTETRETELEKVQAIYEYVVKNIRYDKELADTVESGYVPDLDAVLEKQKGICFDYAALMTGMLRSQSVPCKLVIGYAGEAYHAWISVYTQKDGWIDNAVYFDGHKWKRMDPTFASTSKQSKDMMEYIGDGSNYVEKYLY